jgi:DNA polymerase I-like protein with 3'-5' exonuclease and polymerase domains
MTTATRNGTFPQDARSAAELYLLEGLAPIPLPPRSKDPGYPGWPDLRLTLDSLDAHFPDAEPRNVGILNGAPSGNTLDVDLDCPEARRAAPRLLPPTGWVFGRKTAPGSHRIYRADRDLASAKVGHEDLDGTMLVELRGSGGLTVYPPSSHKDTGERITWERLEDGPAEVALEDLRRMVREVAACALLARHWPEKGSRDKAFMALAGGLLRASGWDAERTARFLEALAVATDDEEARARIKKADRTAAKLEAGKKASGWPTLAGLLTDQGERVVSRVREWLGIATPKVGNAGQQARYCPLPEYVPFPLHTLPPIVGELAQCAAEAIGCDPALVAVPALAVVAGCIGNSRALQVKRRWSEPCIVWSGTVAVSGGHKSPAYQAAVDPLVQIQMDLYERHKQTVEEYEQALEEWQARPKGERGDKPREPGEPICFLTSDATIEVVGELLEDNPRGLLMARDELDAWFGSFTRYKSGKGGSDRPHWLELHRAGVLDVRRLTRERRRLSVRRAVVSVTGTIQPAILQQALDRDALEAGLGARFLLCMPPRRRRRWTEADVPEEVEQRYQRLLHDLLNLPLQDTAKRKPYFLGMSGPAKRLFIDFYNEWGNVQFQAEGAQAAAFAKLEAYAPRLILLHHVVSHVAAGVPDTGPITEASVRAGIELTRWFAAEAVRVYAMLRESDEERQTRKLIEWIAEQSGRVTVKQLQRSNSRRWTSSELAEAALEDLVRSGLGRWEEDPPPRTGGRRKRWFVLTAPAPDVSDDRPDDEEDGGGGAADHRPDDNPPPSPPPFGTGTATSYSRNGSGTDPGTAKPRSSETSGADADSRPCEDSPPADAAPERRSERSSGAGAESPPYLLVHDAAGLAAVAAALDGTALVGLDLETTGLDLHADRVRLLSLSTDTIDGGRFTYLVDCFAVGPRPLWEALAGKELVIHNAAFDLGFLRRLGFTPTGEVRDTMLLAQLLTAGTNERATLAACCARYLGRTLDKTEQRSDWSGRLTDDQLRYAAADAEVLVPLLEALSAGIAEAKLVEAAGIEQRCLPAMVWLGHGGVGVDRDAWQALARAAAEEADRLREALDRQSCPQPSVFEGVGGWNWDSPAQVKEALARAGCPVDKTDDDSLAAVVHPLAELLRQYRAASKRTKTYGAGWLEHVRPDGRVYPGWKQIGSRAGRMSCTDPNMQQLPRGEYRRCVVAPPGRVLVKADYSQIELRIAAKVSGDKALLDAYRRGEDLHTRTARSVLGIEEVTKQHRQLAKALNFGLLYGMGAQGFRGYAKSQYGLDLSEEDARRYRDAFFRNYPGLAAWHRRVGRSGKRTVETRTLAGRRRLEVARFTEKLNSPVQGTGADGLKLALALLWERREQAPGAFPVLAVHDEIVVEADTDRADAVADWLRGAMVDAMAPLIEPVPVEVEVKVARTWGGG